MSERCRTRSRARAVPRDTRCVRHPDAVTKARLFARLIKVEHTIFALPFAYVGAFLAVDGVPSAHDLLWITVAMVGARSLAMALNRLIDAGIDARNPRTAGREIPSGMLTIGAVLAFSLASLAVFLDRGLAAEPGRALALADPRGDVRRLPLPQALHVALPPLARRGRRARPHGRVGRDHGDAPVAGVGARRSRRDVGRRVRHLLLALRRRDRQGSGAPLVGGALRGARRVSRCALDARRDRGVPRRRRARASTSTGGTGPAWSQSPASSPTSTR